ncbi:UTRA domain-containing protein [Actinomadura madurae]|uniref:UTRA domain-containing protein n=1 Tax=Actinomadura madurae TaxID=1993 RepID=UPI002026ECB8|nr:UTRA domain-containing protein [Actinomadura madurae]MCP9947685.1 UTRA domain-containing protein [Actinomadura madurae]MCP9964455.1 UTRA domain-containing protein [Actinomadura madurae]MCP9976935.1 UTRA domain-containing protein [Actinomadura madurae]URM93348.1 UTRA domain-containing protein [Actinomadura madurae]
MLGLDLAGRDLFALIEEVAGQPLGRAEVTLDAVGAGPGLAVLLGVAEGAAVFAVGRLTRLADGRPVDCEDIRIRADRLTFHATLYRGAAARREPEP